MNMRNSISTWRGIAVGLAVLSTALVVPTSAQVVGGTLIGTVIDPNQAVITNGKVSIEDQATKIVRVVYTNHDGLYAAPNLQPGSYLIAASAPGFSVKERRGVVITVGDREIVDFSLDVAQAAKTDVVVDSTDGRQLHVASSDLTEEVGGQTLREMPLNGRSWTDLAILQPGVVPVVTQPSFTVGTDRGTRGFGSELIVSGGRPQENNYRLDGISMNDYANGAPGSVLGGNLGVDAIQEFSVITTNASAEYGKTAGGVINAVTRSGGNELHGSVYELARDSFFDAPNYFDSGSTPPFTRNQFGGALGGPLVKDNTFFFANYEGLRQSQSVTTIATVPSANARNGILQNSDGSTTNLTLDPAAQQYLVFWPQPYAGLTPSGNGNTGFYKFGSQQTVNEEYGTAKVDHRFSDHDAISATYLYDRAPYTYPDGLNDVLYASTTARQLAAIEENHLRTRFVNSFRVGLNREAVNNAWGSTALNPAAADSSLGATSGQYAAQVSISGLTGFTGGLHATGGTYAWTDYQVYDDAFFSRGHQSLKIGFIAERMLLSVFTPSNPGGQFIFGSLTNFLTNTPSQYNAQIPQTVTPRDLRETLVGAYIQDDWRWTPQLTLNLGLRYEMSTVPTEAAAKLSTLRNLSDASPHLGNPFFQNPTFTNFEPRVGFAWYPIQGGKTVLRGAMGFYDVLPLPYEFILPTTSAAPFTEFGTVKGNKLPAGSFYKGAESLLGLKALRATYVQPNPKRNYVMQWNFNIEGEITKSLSGVVAYVGSRGVHQPYYSNQFDIVMPTLTVDGYIWPSPIGSGTPINTNYGSIRGLLWNGSSSYHGLEVGIHERLGSSLQFQSSFTWSKSIDNTSSSLAPDAFGNSVSTLPFFDTKLSRGLSDFNVGKALVLNGVWQIPHAKLPNTASLIANGWEFSGIFRANDGVPFTATFGSDGDPMGSGGLQDYPDRLRGSGCRTLTNPGHPKNYVKTNCFSVPTASPAVLTLCDPSFGSGNQCFNLLGNAGRNILIGPGVTNLDASILKNFPLAKNDERMNVQFHVDLFNLLNHPNFALPSDADIFDSTGAPTGDAGVITATSTPSREMQFGVKVNW
jgi:Carboxypeptidase regulatory-like domain/TonB-dependent Receptor Plug Domain/TonB dependent receptor